ncbi:MAG: menaquinone biosynthesis protein [Bacteroidales bacterium]
MVKVAAISYLNTLPFIYGLKNHSVSKQIDLSVCTPSAGADMIISGEVDLGIIPVAAVPFIPNYKIISDYCIGATGKVASVLLCSNVPVNKITKLYLDTDSRSSVMLSRILCRHYWKISPLFENFNFYNLDYNLEDSYIIIGDKALEHGYKFKYVYDLAQEWINFKGKPFVFACWIANKELDVNFINEFNSALKYGIDNIDNAIEECAAKLKFTKQFAHNYLLNNISYNLDKNKKEGLQDFWTLALEELKSKVRW